MLNIPVGKLLSNVYTDLNNVCTCAFLMYGTNIPLCVSLEICTMIFDYLAI